MIKNIKACIFDLDGTLVDSMWMWPDIDREYLNRFEIEYDDNLKNEIDGILSTLAYKIKLEIEDDKECFFD